MSAFCDLHKIWVGFLNAENILMRFAPPDV